MDMLKSTLQGNENASVKLRAMEALANLGPIEDQEWVKSMANDYVNNSDANLLLRQAALDLLSAYSFNPNLTAAELE